MQETDSLRDNLLDSNKTDDSCIYFSTNGLESAQRDVLDLSLPSAPMHQVPQMLNCFGLDSIVNNCEDNTTIFDDNSYYLKNYVYKLLPITFEDIDEEIIHKEHDYCSISSSSDKEGEFSKTLDLSLIKNRVYKKKKERSSKQRNSAVENGPTKTTLKSFNSPMESITVNYGEDPQLVDLDFSLINYRARFLMEHEETDYSNLLQPIHIKPESKEKTDDVAELNQSGSKNDSSSEQIKVPEAREKAEDANNIIVHIRCPIQNKYQPSERFKYELRCIASMLARNSHDKINFIDFRKETGSDNDEVHKVNYLLAEDAWKSFKSSSDRIILTNDKSIGEPTSKKEENEAQTFYILNDCSLRKLLENHSQEIGASLTYRVLKDFSGEVSLDIPENGEICQVDDLASNEVENVDNGSEEQFSGIINSGLLKTLLSKSSITNFKNTIGNLIGRIKCNECIEQEKPCDRCMELIDKTNLNKTSPNLTDDLKRNLPSKKYWSRMVDVENISKSNPIVEEVKPKPKKRGRKKKEQKILEEKQKEQEQEKEIENSNVERAEKSCGIINSGILKALLKNSKNNFVEFENQNTQNLVEEYVNMPNQISNNTSCVSPEKESCITNGLNVNDCMAIGGIPVEIGPVVTSSVPVNEIPDEISLDKSSSPKNQIPAEIFLARNYSNENQTYEFCPFEKSLPKNQTSGEFHPLGSSSPKNKISVEISPVKNNLPNNQIPDKICLVENYLPENDIPNEILPAENSLLKKGEPSQINKSLEAGKTGDKKKKKKPATVKKPRRSLEISVEEVADLGLGVEKRTRSGREAPELVKKATKPKKSTKLRQDGETEPERQSILKSLLINAAEKINLPIDSPVLCDILPSMENLNIPMTKANKNPIKKRRKSNGNKKKKASKSTKNVESNGSNENITDQGDLNGAELDNNLENSKAYQIEEKNDEELNFLGFNVSDLAVKDDATGILSNNLSDNALKLNEDAAEEIENKLNGDHINNDRPNRNLLKEFILEVNGNNEDSNISTVENNLLASNDICADENNSEEENKVLVKMKNFVSEKIKKTSKKIADSSEREIRRGRGRPRKSLDGNLNCDREPCLENSTVVPIVNSQRAPLGDIEEDFQEIKMQLEKDLNEPQLNGISLKQSDNSSEELESRPINKVEPFRNRLRSTNKNNLPVEKSSEIVTNEVELYPENVQETPKLGSKNIKKRKGSCIYTHFDSKKSKDDKTVETLMNESVDTSQENKNPRVKFDPQVTWKFISPLMGYNYKDMSVSDVLNSNLSYERKTRSGRSISNDTDAEDVEMEEPPKKKQGESSVSCALKLEPKPEIIFDKKSILRRRTLDSTALSEENETQADKNTANELVVQKKKKVQSNKNESKKLEVKKKAENKKKLKNIRSSERLKKTLKK